MVFLHKTVNTKSLLSTFITLILAMNVNITQIIHISLNKNHWPKILRNHLVITSSGYNFLHVLHYHYLYILQLFKGIQKYVIFYMDLFQKTFAERFQLLCI